MIKTTVDLQGTILPLTLFVEFQNFTDRMTASLAEIVCVVPLIHYDIPSGGLICSGSIPYPIVQHF